MNKMNDNKWACDYGSRSRLSIGLNAAHVVIAIDEDGDASKRSSVAFTPATLHALATRLLLLAEAYDRRLRDDRSMFIAIHEATCHDDLVAALEPFADIGVGSNPDYAPMIRLDRDAILAARAALAKARGE